MKTPEEEVACPDSPMDTAGLERVGLALNYLVGNGLEIGGLQRPLAVGKSAKVKYVDRMPVSELRRHYPELTSVDLVEVDIIDDGERLETIADFSQDFVIANHFIEHCQDPILFIKNMLRVLRNGGIIYLAIPDKRYTFDRNRPDTPVEHMVRDYSEGPEWSRKQHFMEWARCVNNISDETGIDDRANELMRMDYSIHFHVWSQSSMLDFFSSLQRIMPEVFEVEAFLKYQEECIWIVRKINARLQDPALLTALSMPTLYAIEAINEIAPGSQGHPMLLAFAQALTVRGWAVDVKAQSVAGGAFFEIDGITFPTVYGMDRPDVAKALARPTCRYSGFECEIPTTALALGEHVLSLKIFTNDQKSYYQSGEMRVRFEVSH